MNVYLFMVHSMQHAVGLEDHQFDNNCILFIYRAWVTFNG